MRTSNLFLVTFTLASLLSCSNSDEGFKRGHWTVINYWAVWCKPCREEIPELNQLNLMDGVDVVGVNFDRKTGDALAADASALGISFDHITDPSQRLGIERPTVLPTTVILSPAETIEVILVGPQTKETLCEVISLCEM